MGPHIAAVAGLLLFSLVGCNKALTPAEEKLKTLLHVEATSVTPRSAGFVNVAYRVTNKAAVHIVRAKVLITVLDSSGAELGSRKHYVLTGSAGGAGGLAPGASKDGEVLITVKDKAKAAGARFELDYLRDATGAKVGAGDETPQGEAK
jgi:hypothetical protein